MINKNYLDKEVKILGVAEGFEFRPYADTRGYMTWGTGRCYQNYPLTKSERDFVVKICSMNQDTTNNWTLDQTTFILSNIDKDRARVIADFFVMQVLMEIDARLCSNFGWYMELEDARRCVWLDWSYNMGLGTILGFKQTIKRMEDEQFEEIAKDCLTWPWANDVGKAPPAANNPKGQRAWYISEMMRSGEFPEWIT